MTPEQEQEHLSHAQAGDGAALGQLLAHHGRRVHRAVLAPRLGSASSADEALAAAYYEALTSFHRFQDRGFGLYPWFRQIALRVALKAVRGRAREALWEPADIAREIDSSHGDEWPEFDPEYELAQTRAHVARTLSRLSPDQAEAIRLRILEEKSREELAERWGMKLNAVDQRVHRAKSALRAALQVEDNAQIPIIVLVVNDGSAERVHVFARDVVTVGRAPSSALQLDSTGVSRHHAAFRCAERRVSVEDLGSRNGVLVDGWRVERSDNLRSQHLIKIGGYHLRVLEDPVTSLWAGAVLAEGARESERIAERIAARRGDTSGLPPTTPLTEARRDDVQGVAKAVSSSSEDRLEAALRAAWGFELGDASGPRATEALARIERGERE